MTHKIIIFCFALLLCLSLFSCKKKIEQPVVNVLNPKRPQETVTIAGKPFTLELSRTQRQRARGLMFRSSLAEDEGMLFVFEDSEILSFYMENCLIDLDLIYLDENGVIIDIMTMSRPQPGRPFKYYTSSQPARYAIELAAGVAKKLNLQPGQKIDLPPQITPSQH